MTFFGNNYNIHGRFRCFFDYFRESFGGKQPDNPEAKKLIEDFGNNYGKRVSNRLDSFPPSERLELKKKFSNGTGFEDFLKKYGASNNLKKLNSNPDFNRYYEQSCETGKNIEEIAYDFYYDNLDSKSKGIFVSNVQEYQKAKNCGMTNEQYLSFKSSNIRDLVSNINFNVELSSNSALELADDISELGINAPTVLELFKNNKQDLGFILLDTLISIRENKGNIFDGNVVLGERGIKSLENLAPQMDPKSLSLDTLGELFDREGIIKPVIENALNDRFINGLQENRIGLNGEISDADVKVIASNTILTKKFIDYYNYKNSGTGKEININIENLSPEEQIILETAIKEELYVNAYDVNLSEEDKDRLDAELQDHYNENKKRREMWGKGRYYLNRHGEKSFENVSNYNDVPGWKIAINLNIGDRISDEYNPKIEEIDKKDRRVLNLAWAKFYKENIQFHGNKLPRNQLFFKKFYEQTGGFLNFEGEKWEKIKKMYGNEEDIKKLRSALQFFDVYLKDAHKELCERYSRANKINNSVNNNSVIGSVIDGVRDIFSNLGKNDNVDGKKSGLLLDENSPIELTDDNKGLIINGTFNGEPVKIKYDLETGKVYMNTCIVNKGDMIIFGEKAPNNEIGKIEDFRSMLNYYGTAPRKMQNGVPKRKSKEDRIQEKNDRREAKLVKLDTLLASQITKIGEKIGENTRINQIKNEVSTRFLRTLGIIDEFSNGVVQFEKGSDAYNVMQLINNSKNSGDIQALSDGMEILVKYAGMNWGNKTVDKKKSECIKLSTLAKAKNNALSDGGENLPYFWGKIKDINILENGVGSVPETYKNGFASLILDKFTNGGTSPNWILDKSNIENFVSSITSGVGLAYQMYAGNIG